MKENNSNINIDDQIRAIIGSTNDRNDAYIKLLKLGLSEPEIVALFEKIFF